MSFKPTLDSLQSHSANPAVSIFVKTHRTFPSNEKDHIFLKNALSAAQDMIEDRYDNNVANSIIESIESKFFDWDHNYNLDTLAIFATQDHVEVLRLPFHTKPRIVVSEQFAVRDLIADKQQSLHYLAIVVTREMSRLFECKNTQVIREFHGESVEQEASTVDFWFPMTNEDLHATNTAEKSDAISEDNYLKEFLNRCDKALQTVNGRLPDQLPIFVIGDRRNIAFYEEVCDTPNRIIGFVDNAEHLDRSPESIIGQCEDKIHEIQDKASDEIREDIAIAKSNDLLSTDEQSIYEAIYSGNAQTLIVDQNHFASGFIDEGQQRFAYGEDTSNDNYYDDVVESLIRLARQHGGEVKFFDKNICDDDHDLYLIRRF